VSGVDYAKLERDTLAHIDERYYYGAFCRKCRHGARLSLIKLREHLGPAFPLARIRERLACERCGSKAVTVTFLSPDQKTGNLVQLFGEKPRK
jgi:hypothetical protein